MKIATWNINSVRLRIAQVLKFLKEQQPDVLCLQETKTQDVYFPAKEIADAGFSYQAIRGEKSYNGVAILSRLPIENVSYQDGAAQSWQMENRGNTMLDTNLILAGRLDA